MREALNVGDKVLITNCGQTNSAKGSVGKLFTVHKVYDKCFYAVCDIDFNKQTRENNTISSVQHKDWYKNYRTAFFDECSRYTIIKNPTYEFFLGDE